METHYVCSECGTVSKLAGTCQNDVCIRQGTHLTECHCTDGKHMMIMRPTKEEITQDIDEQKEEAKQNDYSVTTIDLDTPEE